MTRILFLGGPIDGQLKDVDEVFSPMIQSSIKVTLPNGLVVEYNVNFFSGNTLQFPLACFEGLQPDDIFKMLLQWYSIKSRVRPMAPPTAAGPEPPPTDLPPTDPPLPDPPRIITTGG